MATVAPNQRAGVDMNRKQKVYPEMPITDAMRARAIKKQLLENGWKVQITPGHRRAVQIQRDAVKRLRGTAPS